MSTPAFDLTALTPAELVMLLQKAGARTLTEDKVRVHLEAGAPQRADGRIHFTHYTAWLAKHVK
jgi:hypothetical protein